MRMWADQINEVLLLQ